MLILTRRVGETVVIGNEVFCTLLPHDKFGELKLAFDAPKNVAINRYEIHRRILYQLKGGPLIEELKPQESIIERLGTGLKFNKPH